MQQEMLNELIRIRESMERQEKMMEEVAAGAKEKQNEVELKLTEFLNAFPPEYRDTLKNMMGGRT